MTLNLLFFFENISGSKVKAMIHEALAECPDGKESPCLNQFGKYQGLKSD